MNLTSGLIGAILSYLATVGFVPLKNVVVNVDNETLFTLAIFGLLVLYVELRFRGLKSSMKIRIMALSQQETKKARNLVKKENNDV